MTLNPTLFHCLRYRDAVAALDYLAAGLGLEKTAAYVSPNDPTRVDHAQMSWPGGGGIMFGSASDGAPTGVAFAYLVLAEDADVDRVHQRALDHGFTSVREPAEMDYGGRGSTVADPEGNEWSLGSYRGE